jgi:nitrate/nitrite-specific signal transduction histidine kinase
MKIAWLSFELCAGMEMAAASIDEACSIKMARRRILDRIRSALNVLEKLLEEATDLLRRKDQKSEGRRRDNFGQCRE